MSDQTLNATPSGNSSKTGTAPTGTYPVIESGKNDPALGKELPQVIAEKPDLEQLAKELNTVSQSIGRDLRFQVDLDRGNAVLQVIDSETGEIIRQIPHESAAQAFGNSGSARIRLIDALV